MFSKRNLTMAISVFGIFFAMSIFMSFTTNIAIAQADDFPDLCENNDQFTQDFLTDNCRFKAWGYNPYFILLPGFQFVLETPEDADEPERAVVTVLRKTKRITLEGRRINTSVVEERALEWEEGEDGEEDEWRTVEISLNWIAICNKTNDVYYFGEWSRDCEDGFDENDVCRGVESNDGSWEAGVGGAKPGILMPGTFLLGAKYFQEIAPPDAIDRGQHVAMGKDVVVPAGEWENCVKAVDTNPAAGECDVTGDDADIKTYCPGIGLVQDKDLVLVDYGFVRRGGRLH